MSAAGAGTYRVNFPWSQVEPTRGRRDWAHTDQIVRRASARKMQVVPVLIASPRFAASRNAYPPRASARAAYAAFVRDVVARYGADGEFWDLNRDLPYRPIKVWQVWNEPNFAPYWNRKPDARSYVRFLKLTHDAIASQDETAKVVLGGLSDTKLNGRPNLVPFLGQVYAAGGGRYFDIAAVNLYAGMPQDVLHLIRTIRSRMRRSGDARTRAVADRVRLGQRGRVQERADAEPEGAGHAPAPDLPPAAQGPRPVPDRHGGVVLLARPGPAGRRAQLVGHQQRPGRARWGREAGVGCVPRGHRPLV